MAFTEEQEATLKEMASNWKNMQDAIEIAKDELMRVKVAEHYQADAVDMSTDARDNCVLARSIFRKMYRHHADMKKYPQTIQGIKAMTKSDVATYFKDITDPDPDSDGFRTIGT